MASTTRCPKCGYQRQTQDHHVHELICPSCGIAYAKWRGDSGTESQPQRNLFNRLDESDTPSRFAELRQFFLYVPDQIDSLAFWGRVVLLSLFSLWGAWFIFHGVNWETIGSSFLHNVNLPFHEFGHVLFSPFGNFMLILGGSLFQILMPLIALFSFSWQMRDNFAAAIMLWWSGQNMIDVAPYIADAKTRSLPLIRGLSDDYHDWGNLLTMLNCVDSAPTIANITFLFGVATIIFAIYWATLLLLKQKRNLHEFS